MRITHELLIDCSAMTAAEFSDKCLIALGHGPNFKLKADSPTDVVHGSVSIVHYEGCCEITVECYHEHEEPTACMSHGVMTGRQSTLACCENMPTEQMLRDRLDTLITEYPK